MLHRSSCRIKRTAFESLAEGLVRKVSDILYQPAFQAAPSTCPLYVWRGGRGQRRVIVLKVMSHTFGKTITDCYLATDLTLTGKELDLVKETNKFHLDIAEVSSTKRRGSGIVDLDGGWKLFCSGADPSMSDQAGN